MDRTRKTGVLLHITSLPSEYGIGDLGENALSFAEELGRHSIGLWQLLPLGPTGFGDSPYSARSAFAGNELLISPKELYKDGWLKLEDVLRQVPSTSRVDYGGARELKLPMLRKAADKLLSSSGEAKRAYKSFRGENSWWLEDYALFQALCDKYNDSRWFLAWPEALRDREEHAMAEARARLEHEVSVYCALQYFFHVQYQKLKDYANGLGVKLIGDIPIFVAYDSADAWSHRDLLMLTPEGKQEGMAGVPPDLFSATGQLWGNPTYRWDKHRETGFAWWIERFKENFKLYDIVRVDHFRGFEACWEVPAGSETAETGEWVKSPGQEIFDALRKVIGEDLPVIAEDLGIITPEVEALRLSNGFPGMKILQFAFGLDDDGGWITDNAYLPQSSTELSVFYTGTHDNNTLRGWYEELDDKLKDYIRRYFECADTDIVRSCERALMMTNAIWVIFPMQDILNLGAEARMNVPATCGSSNWSWRMLPEDIHTTAWEGIGYYTKLYGRCE